MELAQVENTERHAKFVTNLLFRNYGRSGIVWFTRVASKNQAATSHYHLLRHYRSVLFRRASPNGMVTTAVKKELKRFIHVWQME
jgi:hypothetical protein